MNNDTRQSEYTELTAACGHQIVVRLDASAVVAADMISVFMNRDCGRSTCPTSRPSTRLILWADLKDGQL